MLRTTRSTTGRLALVMLAALAAVMACGKPGGEPEDQATAEIRIQVPDFQLVDQNGQAFGSQDLHGKAWIAAFIFTRCTSICPAMTAQLAQLQEELRSEPTWQETRLVSFTVDPQHDTPEVLESYAGEAGADQENWRFLTGERSTIWRLSKHGFKLAVAEDPENAEMPILHSQKLALVDRGGAIRGFYDSLSRESLDELKGDLARILEEPFAARLPYPEEILDPPWLGSRAEAQLATVDRFEVFHDFGFVDRLLESGITFENRVTDDSGKYYKPVHYDHGNGIAVADVDGDERLDVYFTNQVGSNELWRNLGGGKFENITEKAGVGLADRISVTGSFADTDNDGDADLFVTTVRGGNALFINDGKGRFEDRTSSSGLEYSGHSSCGLFFDYDRDGLLDLFLCNVGVYTTDEVGEGGYYVGVDEAFSGHLKPERTERSLLYRNQGDNRFVDVSEQVGLVDDSWTGDASPVDANNDGWPDLYVLNMQGHDQYFENVEGDSFVRKSRQLFPKTPWGSMGIKAFDYDNDGDTDLILTDMHSDMSENIGPEREKLKSRMQWPEEMLQSDGMSIFGNAFYRNRGDGTFEEVSDEIGTENYWPWGLSVGDLNGDGWQDVFITASMNFGFRYGVNSVLLNNRGRVFLDSEFILGVEPRRGSRTAKYWFRLDCTGADMDNPRCEELGLLEPAELWGAVGSRSSAIFDLDDDGDLDIVTNEFHDVPMVLISNLAEKREVRWLAVELVGKDSNRDGLGAKVVVRAGPAVYTQVYDGQSGYLSQSRKPIYFGLGSAERVDRIDVVWPSGTQQTVPGPIEVNRRIEVREP